MIAIARKRKQNSAYTTKGEARPGYPARASTLWWLGQLPVSVLEILTVMRVDDDTSLSLKRVLKTRNKDGDKNSERTFCFCGWLVATVS
jgi:hypothetical protein